jgi:hypothetical protein
MILVAFCLIAAIALVGLLMRDWRALAPIFVLAVVMFIVVAARVRL